MMPWELLHAPLLLPAFVLVFFRTGAMLLAAPLFSSLAIPVRVRIALALALAFVIFPLVLPEVPASLSLSRAIRAILGELTVGIVLGFGLGIVFYGVELAGTLIEREAGLALAEVFNPLIDSQSSILGQLFSFIVFIAFLAVDGHHAMVRAVLDSFQIAPVLGFGFSASVPMTLVALLQSATVMGFRIAAPVLIALFLVSMVMGFIMRTVPQINILSVGFSVRVLTALIVTLLALNGLPDVFVQTFQEALEALQAMLVAS